MNRSFKDQHVVSSGAPNTPIIISTDDENMKEIFRFDSNAMNVANWTGHQIHLSFSKSTREITIREILSDATTKSQRAVGGHLTLIGGSYDVDACTKSLAKGGLEAFFIRIVLRDKCRLGMRSLEFDTVRWNHTALEQLHLHKHRIMLRKIKVVKIWMVNPSSNASLNIDNIKDVFAVGQALPMQPTKAPAPAGYKDPDAVATSDHVPVLDYGEPSESSRTMKERQPQWVEVKHEVKNSNAPRDIMEQSQDATGIVGSRQASWKDSRIAELENQLRSQTAAKETAESVNAGLVRTKKLQDWALKEAKTTNSQLKQVLQSRDFMLAILNEEYINHAQSDVSALATALAEVKGIARGDREGVEAGFSSVHVGQPTVDRLLKNPFFASNFLISQYNTTQQKRKANSFDDFSEASDDERITMECTKRLKMN